MTDERVQETPRTYSGALLAAIAVAMLLGMGGMIWCYTLSSKLATQQQALADSAAQNTKLSCSAAGYRCAAECGHGRVEDLAWPDAEATGYALGGAAGPRGSRGADNSSAGNRAAADRGAGGGGFQRRDRVQTDVGGVKTDVAKTKSDLADTNNQLTSMKGDLNGHSTLIARNGEELEILKHKGDRNYYQFTLVRGEKKQVGTVSLELKRADSKKSKFTLAVFSDDKEYEKKDKSLNEPLQFYSGKDPMLFEIVVNNVSAKNTVTGYLSSPKGAPEPVVVVAER